MASTIALALSGLTASDSHWHGRGKMSEQAVMRRTCDNDECKKVWVYDPTSGHLWNFGWVGLGIFRAHGIESAPDTNVNLVNKTYCSRQCALKCIELEMYSLS